MFAFSHNNMIDKSSNFSWFLCTDFKQIKITRTKDINVKIISRKKIAANIESNIAIIFFIISTLVLRFFSLFCESAFSLFNWKGKKISENQNSSSIYNSKRIFKNCKLYFYISNKNNPLRFNFSFREFIYLKLM